MSQRNISLEFELHGLNSMVWTPGFNSPHWGPKTWYSTYWVQHMLFYTCLSCIMYPSCSEIVFWTLFVKQVWNKEWKQNSQPRQWGRGWSRDDHSFHFCLQKSDCYKWSTTIHQCTLQFCKLSAIVLGYSREGWIRLNCEQYMKKTHFPRLFNVAGNPEHDKTLFFFCTDFTTFSNKDGPSISTTV